LADERRRSFLIPGLGLVVIGAAAAYYFTEGPGRGAIPGVGGGQSESGDGEEDRPSKISRPPPGWEKPPPIGEDPDFQGPPPSAPYRDSPYAQPTSDGVLRRDRVGDPDDEELIEAVTDAIEAAGGKVAYLSDEEDVDSRWDFLRPRLVVVHPQDLPDLEIAANAERLRGQGADFILVDCRTPLPSPWLQPHTSGLRERLRDALPLSHFHPVVRAEAWTLYRIAAPFDLTREEQRRILSFVRRRLQGTGEGETLGIDKPREALGTGSFRVAISLRKRAEKGLKGRPVVVRTSTGATLEKAFVANVDRLRADWAGQRARAEKNHDADLDDDLSEAIEEMEIGIDVFHRTCRITDRNPRRLLWNFELGLEGIFLADGERYHYRLPHVALHRGDGESGGAEGKFIEMLETDAGLEVGTWRERRLRFGRFETKNFVELAAGGEPTELYRGAPLVRLSQMTKANVVRALRIGSRWLTSNQLPDGQFRYRYKPLNKVNKRWLEGNNVVRHALNPYTLMLVNRVWQQEHLVESAQKGLGYTMRHLKKEGRRCYVWHRDIPSPDENAKMGTVAVTILSILKMGEAGVDISEYEDELRCLAQELIYIQDRNGHFRQYDVPEDHPYFGAENAIFPGEMMFALARMFDHSGDARYKRTFDRAMAWYQAWWADRVVKRTDDGIYTERLRMDLVGFVPWAVMALEQMHRKTSEDRYARFAEEMSDWIDELFLFDEHRTAYPDYLGAYFKTHRELPAINSCGYTEGAAAMFAIALRTGREVERRRRALFFGLRFAMQVQYESDATTFWVPDPDVAMGGFRYHLGASRLRNDYSYHAMSALGHAVNYIRDQDWPARSPIPLPESLRDVQ